MSLTSVSNLLEVKMDFHVHVYFSLLALPFYLMPNIYNYVLPIFFPFLFWDVNF